MYKLEKASEPVLYALVKSLNALRVASVGSAVHYETTETGHAGGNFRNPTQTALSVTAADATDLATLIVLCEGDSTSVGLRAVYAAHLADDKAHKVADTANVIAAATVTDLATAQTFLNELKSKDNLHIASTTFHANADATNAIAAADATNQATANALSIELKTDINAHIAAALAGHGIRVAV